MTYSLIFLRYNNKFNRLIKKPPQSLREYQDSGAQILNQISVCDNFNPNDGVSTTQVFNYDGPAPDYMLAIDELDNISRWWVTECSRTRFGQFKVTLYRDVLSDFYNTILEAPGYIDRALCSIGDSAIYNQEDLQVNQILQRKDLLYDETECPWIVGYIPKTYPKSDLGQTGNINFNYFPPSDLQVESIEDWIHYNQLGTFLEDQQTYKVSSTYKVDRKSYVLGLAIELGPDSKKAVSYNTRNWEIETRFESPITYIDNLSFPTSGDCKISTNLVNKIREQVGLIRPADTYEAISAYIPYSLPPSDIEDYVGTIIEDLSSGVRYKVSKKLKREVINKPIRSLSGWLWTELEPVFNVKVDELAYTSTDTFYIDSTVDLVTYYLETIGSKGICSITTNRVHLVDQPYDMFCIPYSDDIYFKYRESGSTFYCPFTKTLALAFAQDIATDLGSGAVFDIQILPYCPVRHLFKVEDGKKIMIDQNLSTTYITDEGGNPVGAVFWCFSSQFSFEIPYNISVSEDPLLFKEQALCEKYRLCSPNMSSFFDFSPTMNNGLDVLEVDCYYKPFNPYIHLNPRFKGLYGSADWEVRGLDLAGNFSLTQVSDAWTNYQLQNKNFESIFNRQQEHLEITRKYQRTEQIISGTAGAIGAGAQVGAATGNIWAAATGTAISAAGAVADVAISDKLHQEQMELNKFNFKANLENIRALPQSLTKVDSLSPNNSLVPYMEYYSCTEIERQAVKNKFKYQSFAINRIGTISEFIQDTPTYIRASVIRLPGLEDDYHLASVIAQELAIGVYI